MSARSYATDPVNTLNALITIDTLPVLTNRKIHGNISPNKDFRTGLLAVAGYAGIV